MNCNIYLKFLLFYQKPFKIASRFYFIINNICKIPIYPNAGNKNFTKLENPKFDTITLIMHIKKAYFVALFLSVSILFSKLEPREIAVVKIAIRIINPYRLLTLGNIFFITYTTGISKVENFTSTFINSKNTHIEIIEIIIELATEIESICFSLFIKSFRLIKTGINKIKL